MAEVTFEQVMEAVELDDNLGFCLECGKEASGGGTDAIKYTCESCGAKQVYGAEELMLMMAG